MASAKGTSTRRRVLLVLILFSLGLAGASFWVFLQFSRQERLAAVKETDTIRVNALAGDAQGFLERIQDRLNSGAELRSIVQSEPDLAGAAVYRPTADVARWSKSQVAGKFQDVSLPFAKALARGAWSQAGELEDGKAGLHLALVPARENAENEVFVFDVRLDRWQRALSRERTEAGSVTFLADSDGKPVVSTSSVSGDWKSRPWLTASKPVGPAESAALTAVSQTDPGIALRSTRKFAEKAALFGLLGIAASIFLSSWFAGNAPVHAPVTGTGELQPELGEEFAHLLSSIRQRIDQIHTDAQASPDSVGEKLESLSHQAEWAAKIFDKMRRVNR